MPPSTLKWTRIFLCQILDILLLISLKSGVTVRHLRSFIATDCIDTGGRIRAFCLDYVSLWILHWNQWPNFYTFFSHPHFSVPTEGRASERKRNGEVPKRQVSSGDGIPSSQNTLLLRQVFASQVVEKIRHQEHSGLVKLSVLQSGYTHTKLSSRQC